MRPTRRSGWILGAGLCATSLVGCRAAEPSSAPDPRTASEAGSRDVGGTAPVAGESVDTIWTYLSRRHDADGDGVVTAEEYHRGKEAFDRLDANRDGRIDTTDFETASPETIQDRMRGLRAQMAVGRLFQADDDPSTLELGELDWRVTEIDTDGDDSLSRAEVERAAEERPLLEVGESGFVAQFLSEGDAWQHLATLDADGSGTLARSEVVGYFESQDDGDGVLELDWGGADASVTSSGPAVGEPAPDFALQPPHGGETFRLSDHRGERPVALVFGSYT